jgi:low temperature requirement protein LtrA
MTAMQSEPTTGGGVRPLELFFDLVFVYAFTQVTGFMAGNPTAVGVGQGLALLLAMWWAWVAYAWLTNTYDAETTAVKVALLSVMGAVFLASLAVPQAFGEDATLFGLSLFAVYALHPLVYWLAAREDPDVRSAVLRLAPGLVLSGALFAAAGLVDGPARFGLWAVALTAVTVAPLVGGTQGWRVRPGHFVERHGLIVIIALGEALVSIGIGLSGIDIRLPQVATALLALVVVGTLWWTYFDVFSHAAERRLTQTLGQARNALARDVFSYLHYPIIAGIVLFALGAKKVMADTTGPIKTIAAVALLGGVALYLLAHVAIRWRAARRLSRPRVLVVAALAVAIPVTQVVHSPGLAVLTGLAALMVGLAVYERITEADVRRWAREPEHSTPDHAAPDPPPAGRGSRDAGG